MTQKGKEASTWRNEAGKPEHDAKRLVYTKSEYMTQRG